jgi:AcrR family transcriptional regulator
MTDHAPDDTRPRPRYGEGRQALLDAAVRVVASAGLRGLTYRAVAAEAGVTQGLVAHHFGSRAALIHEALLAAGAQSIGSTLTPERNPNIASFIAGFGEFIADTEELQAFQFELVLESRRRVALRADTRALYDSYIAATGLSLASAGLEASETMTRLVFAALDGIVIQQLVYGDAARTEETVAELRALLQGLADDGVEPPG